MLWSVFLLSISKQKLAKPCPTESGGCCLPMAAMVPHSWRHRIRQSPNILGNCCLCWCQEWGTMAAAVGHLGHNASTDVVGLLQVVICMEIRSILYQGIGNTIWTRWPQASSSALEPSACQPPWQNGHCAALSGQELQGGRMHGSGGSKLGAIGPGDEFFYTIGLHELINHDGCCCPNVTVGPCSRLWSIQKLANILCNRSTLLKLDFFNY